MKHQDALVQLAQETARARRALAFERALRVGFALGAAVFAWAVLALAGVHERLPLLAQSLSSIAALCAFAWLWLRARRRWRMPNEAEARARLAADSKLDAAAFDALDDRPSRYNDASVALWRREVQHAIARVARARARPARDSLNDMDRFRLRYVLVAAAIGAGLLAGFDGPDRLARAFLPDPGPLLGDREMAIEAWLAPADYTREGLVSISDSIGKRVQSPPSVEATVRLTGPVGPPRLVFEGAGGRREARFVRAADGVWEAKLRLPGAGTLKVVRFHTRAFWRVAPARDETPSAAFAAPIALLADEYGALSYSARDDYGVRRLVLRVRPVAPPRGLAHADPIDTEIDIEAGDPALAEGESEIDLAPHPYAGMEVDARLVAFDALGQEGVSQPLRLRLPEKVFLQPLARAAIEIRRHILAERRPYQRAQAMPQRWLRVGDILFGSRRIAVRDYNRRPALQRAPEGVRRAARLLDALTMSPEDGYFRDLAVYLGLRKARAELAAARAIEQTNLAADTLWRTALRAEYGGAADARRALEEAQRQLDEALARNEPLERIGQLTEALRRATENYLESLVQEALRNGNRENMEDTEEQTELSQIDLERMMREIEELAQQGRNAEAQQQLDQLSGILSNLEVRIEESQSRQGEGEGQPQESQGEERMQQSMEELSQAMGEQRSLREQTEQQRREQSQGGGGGDRQRGQGGAELADRQAQISQGLSQAQRMAEASGAAPSQDLNAAGQAMQRAEQALRRGDLEGAEAAQDAALQSLRRGADALAAQLSERGREGGERGESGRGRDPLGRETESGAGHGDGEGTVPTQADPVRAREIFDEIRRRAQDPNRPEAEREYLRRLLDRFGDS